MRQTLWSVSLIVCAMTVGLLAQAPNSSAPQASKQVVTFSGCVEKAPAEKAPGDEANPVGAAPAASTKFLLTNATAAATTTTTTTSAVGTTGATKPAAKYRLDVDEAKISPHVGHKVEVTGTVEEQPASAAAAATSSAASPKLKVDSIKMIASECK
jgi:hypothetical protein